MSEEEAQEVQALIERARLHWNDRRFTIAGLARLENVSQSELAKQMGMSKQTLNTRLSGVSTIPPWELDGFAVVLGVERHVLEMEPNEAFRWVLDHRPELTARSRCSTVYALVAA